MEVLNQLQQPGGGGGGGCGGVGLQQRGSGVIGVRGQQQVGQQRHPLPPYLAYNPVKEGKGKLMSVCVCVCVCGRKV